MNLLPQALDAVKEELREEAKESKRVSKMTLPEKVEAGHAFGPFEVAFVEKKTMTLKYLADECVCGPERKKTYRIWETGKTTTISEVARQTITIPKKEIPERIHLIEEFHSYTKPVRTRLEWLNNRGLVWPEMSNKPAPLDPEWTSSAEVEKAILEGHHLIGIQGPPGSGKTRAMARAVKALCDAGKKCIVTAKAHAAVDNALGSCERSGIKGVNYGKERGGDRNKASLIGVTCDALMMNSELEADYLFLDEAGQIPAFYLAALSCHAEHLIVLGDDCQLQPITKRVPSRRNITTGSALGALRKVPGAKLLAMDTSDRLCSAIAEKVSVLQYGGNLKAGENKECCLLTPRERSPVCGIHTLNNMSRAVNNADPDEARRCADLALKMLEYRFRKSPNHEPQGLTAADIAIVTPYRHQNAEIRYALGPLGKDILTGTAHALQGQSKLVTIISTATPRGRALENSDGWLCNWNLWNVAISRASAVTLILADIETLEGSQIRKASALESRIRLVGFLKETLTIEEWAF